MGESIILSCRPCRIHVIVRICLDARFLSDLKGSERKDEVILVVAEVQEYASVGVEIHPYVVLCLLQIDVVDGVVIILYNLQAVETGEELQI